MRTLRNTGLVAWLCLLTAGSGCHLLFPFESELRDDAGSDTPAVVDSVVRADTGNDGTGNDGTGNDGTGNDGTGNDGTGNDGMGPTDVQVEVLTPDSAIWKPPGTWITLPKGSFLMGSPSSELCRGAGEVQHKVTFTRKLEIQSTEVTQAQYKSIMNFNPTKNSYCGPLCAADGMTFHYAAGYCNALSAKAGLSKCYSCTSSGLGIKCTVPTIYDGVKIYNCNGYRLPTEAEWEYAYRAGTTTALYKGKLTIPSNLCTTKFTACANANAIAWYDANKTGGGPNPKQPKQKKPNAWGLYDMAGNLWEWCHDHSYSHPTTPVTDPVGNNPTKGQKQIVRGGAWADVAASLRAAARQAMSVGDGGGTNGFRCVRNVP